MKSKIGKRLKAYIDEQVETLGKQTIVLNILNDYDNTRDYPEMRQNYIEILNYLGYDQTPSGAFTLR
jgi:hypothetical protein